MTCETMDNTATDARSAPCCDGVSQRAQSGCANGFEAWPRPAERPQRTESTPTPPISGRRGTEAMPETGESRSALIRNLPERIVTATAFLGWIMAGIAAGFCLGAILGRVLL